MRTIRNRVERLEAAAQPTGPRPLRVVIQDDDGSLWTGPDWEDDRQPVDPATLAGCTVIRVKFEDMEGKL